MIYIASKTVHAPRWRKLRAAGLPITSTWIDEAGAGESKDLFDLWRRCIGESGSCDLLILYREPEEVLKGAWIELGSALAKNKPVFAMGIEDFTIANHGGIRHYTDFETMLIEAVNFINEGRHARR